MKQSLVSFLILGILVGCASPTAPVAKHQVMPAEVGNGGHGVKKADGKVYLLDLWEIGIEETVKIEIPSVLSKRILSYRRRLEATFPEKQFPRDIFPLDAFAVKLADMDSIDSYLTNTILYAIEVYGWSLADITLKDLSVEGEITRSLEGETFPLIANRRGQNIFISAPQFRLMNPANRVALLIHEAVFSLLPPQKVMINSEATMKQDSVRARLITGLFFREDLQDKLRNAGFGSYLRFHELPFLTSKWSLNPKDADAATNGTRYASTFLLNQNSKYRTLLPNDLTGAVGGVFVEVPPQPDMNLRIGFYYQDEECAQKIDLICSEWSKGKSKRLDIDLLFRSRSPQEKLVEHRFKQYHDRGQVKDYLEHIYSDNELRIPVSEFNRNYDPERIADQVKLLANIASRIVIPVEPPTGSGIAIRNTAQDKRKEVCVDILGKAIPQTFDMIFPHRAE